MLKEELLKEIERCRELKKLYDEIPTGGFGSVMINMAIKKGENAIIKNDAIEMLVAVKELKEIEG